MKQIKIKHIALAAISVLALGSCKEDIADEARYTFTGHTVASFLEENKDVYSSFITILERGGRLNLMKAYGQYTCFAPTNDAIAYYLYEQDSIYHATKDTKNPVWTGVTSPELSELSDSMCKVLSQTHLLPEIYLTTDMEGEIIPTMNLNDRYLSLDTDVDENNYPVLLINGNGKIIAKDEEVENGVVHTIAAVLNPSANTLPTQIESHAYFRIISEAIERTGYADKLQLYKDETYTDGDKTAPNIYNKVQVPYPANRYYGFCAFVEPDTVYNEAGIFNFDDLVAKCAEWYPEADRYAPLTSLDNPVNQFVGYHLLDRNLAYDRLVCYNLKPQGKYNSEDDFPKYSDRYEFYETMSNKILKITMPRSVPSLVSTILLNYYKEDDSSVDQFMNVKVLSPKEFRESDSTYIEFSPSALNGNIHPINKLLIYNEDVMVGRVLNTIIRFDASSLCPELTNNNVRGNFHVHGGSDGDVFIPHTFCENMKVYTDETRHYYLSPHTGWCNYQGDEMMTLGAFDFAYKLPNVPAGTYEIRMGYTANTLRHVIQFYIDDEVAGIPVDLRIKADDKTINYEDDTKTDDNGVQNDKEMKNRGYVKAPTTFNGYGTELARTQPNIIRKVITTKYLSEGDHWIRFKNVNEADDGSAQFMHDYFELVPITFLRNESLSLEEKRQ